MTDSVLFVITGGTIDSYYDGARDTAVTNKETIIPEMLSLVKSQTPFEFVTVCMKDSRQLDSSDLDKILETIEKTDHSKIIVTHGTYTMPDTARFLKANLKDTTKTILFTGSLIPIKGFSPSDGPFNLGYAIAQLEHLAPGVYVAMNAHIFTPEEVVKRVSEGRFASILGEQ